MFKKISLAVVLTASLSTVALAQSAGSGGAQQNGSSSVIASAPKGLQKSHSQSGAQKAPSASHHAQGISGHSHQAPASGAAHQGGSGSSHIQAPKIDINNADKSTLEMLPGIGPKEAEKIVQYSKDHKFKSVDEMYKKIPGIKKSKVANFSDILKAGGGEHDHASSHSQQSGNSQASNS